MTMRSEEIRLRYLYRRLIIDGKVNLSFEAARRLVGPDCAYHLYALGKGKKAMDSKKSRSMQRTGKTSAGAAKTSRSRIK
jgi:hypothetical protein